MTTTRLIGSIVAATLLGSFATAATAKTLASASLQAADGAARGSAILVSHPGKLELRVAAIGLPAGVHGIHLHSAGACDGPGFTTAGAHLNPGCKMHGKDNPQGSHLGDLPNLTAAANGKATLTSTLAGSPADLMSQLFDADGTAVVIHAGPDDYKTDPSGNSGGRIACGVFKRR